MAFQPDDTVKKILDFYKLDGRLINAVSYGNGHINNTICLTYETSVGRKQYILQKINKYVFHHPEELMENAVAITEHLRKKIAAGGGDPERETVNIVSAPGGAFYYLDERQDVWRIEKFVENTKTYQVADSPELMYETGRAFGHFQYQLSDFPASSLYETIPGFHNTRARYSQFAEIAEKDPLGRAAECRDEIRFVLERKEIADFAMNSFDRGELPVRVAHNDTKINNILFDIETGKPVCVIDLDTVMPGFAMNDFGDGIRTGACTGAEDEKDVDKIHLDLVLFKAYLQGFLEGTENCLTPFEIKTLPMGGICITYEQALRFLADYLQGDPYYKTAYKEHNLVRTRTQIKMVREMEAQWDMIQNSIS